jgi:hypothetical protein
LIVGTENAADTLDATDTPDTPEPDGQPCHFGWKDQRATNQETIVLRRTHYLVFTGLQKRLPPLLARPRDLITQLPIRLAIVCMDQEQSGSNQVANKDSASFAPRTRHQ